MLTSEAVEQAAQSVIQTFPETERLGRGRWLRNTYRLLVSESDTSNPTGAEESRDGRLLVLLFLFFFFLVERTLIQGNLRC